MENVDAANLLLSPQHKQSENSQMHSEKGGGRGNLLIKGKTIYKTSHSFQEINSKW